MLSAEFSGGVLTGIILTSLIALWVGMRLVRANRAHTLTVRYLQSNLTQVQEMFQMTVTRLMRLANSSFDTVLVVDSERRLTILNDQAEALFKVTQTVVGDTLIGVTGSHLLDKIALQVIVSREMQDDQLELNHRSYKVRVSWVDSRTIVLALQDITDLLRLTRARRDMVANISHELRTPISSIRLMVDTLTQNYGKNPERDLTKLSKIDRETESLQYLVQELHDLSMIETGKAIMRMIETPFNLIVHDALTRMSSQVETKGLMIINEIPGDLIVLADPDQTRRVLTNLISNAIKYTPSGGRITFRAESGDEMATIRVSDTGVGIPPNERDRIFERFYQVDTARTGGSGGSGLGLAIAKHIIEAQGGRIWAEAPFLQGACIAFTLPLNVSVPSTGRN